MAATLTLDSIDISKDYDFAKVSALEDLFLLVDGRLGIATSSCSASFEDKPLQNLYILKNAISLVLFGEEKLRKFSLRSFFSGDEITFHTMNSVTVVGEVTVFGKSELEFDCELLDLSKQVGAHLREIERALLSCSSSLPGTWPHFHVFSGVTVE